MAERDCLVVLRCSAAPTCPVALRCLVVWDCEEAVVAADLIRGQLVPDWDCLRRAVAWSCNQLSGRITPTN